MWQLYIVLLTAQEGVRVMEPARMYVSLGGNSTFRSNLFKGFSSTRKVEEQRTVVLHGSPCTFSFLFCRVRSIAAHAHAVAVIFFYLDTIDNQHNWPWSAVPFIPCSELNLTRQPVCGSRLWQCLPPTGCLTHLSRRAPHACR